MSKTSVLKGLGVQAFLKNHWQKKPLLIRKAFSTFPRLISPDELAGLSCERGIDSRIVSHGKSGWNVARGPFSTKTFKNLPKKNWTLLVNGVDRAIPDIHLLMDQFSFLPNWRLDDIMISYAVNGGNVGAHVDNFDVFLIQAEGRREWRIEMTPQVEDNFKPNLEIKLLKKFRPSRTWILEPGDMLYLPPRFAHHGIARGDGCMTYSIGFRAPSAAELLDSAATHALASLQHSMRYQDPDLQPQHPGEIKRADLKRLRDAIIKAIPNDDSLAEWFGSFITKSELDGPTHAITSADLRRATQRNKRLRRSEDTKIAFTILGSKSIVLFANGDSWTISRNFLKEIKILTGGIKVDLHKIRALQRDKKTEKMLLELLSRGAFRFDE